VINLFLHFFLFTLFGADSSPTSGLTLERSQGQLITTTLLKDSTIIYLTGDSSDIVTETKGGLLLMGGGKDVTAAMKWFLKRSGGGDIVVIRSSGADGYNEYLFNLVPVHSVETIILDSREKAMQPQIAAKIRNAEGLFIAGGNQLNYVHYWKGTETQRAINYLLNEKKVPVGGTSAGLAILGEAYYSAAYNTSATSDRSLSNPYDSTITVEASDFLQADFLKATITDSHYSQRNRNGRHVVFMARLCTDFGYSVVKGIGVDEQTALCIDEKGIGIVFGLNEVWFMKNLIKSPKLCKEGIPLTWGTEKRGLELYRIKGSENGHGYFDAGTWKFKGGFKSSFFVQKGQLIRN
jgi:cyanophycinase-like exopeptidase